MDAVLARTARPARHLEKPAKRKCLTRGFVLSATTPPVGCTGRWREARHPDTPLRRQVPNKFLSWVEPSGAISDARGAPWVPAAPMVLRSHVSSTDEKAPGSLPGPGSFLRDSLSN